MTDTLLPTCPLTSGEPDCAKRLVLRECLEQWQRRAESGIVDTGRYRCRYVVWGRGPTLVLVPGMGMDAVGYAMLMARLQSDFRCVSFDLPNGAGDGARLLGYRHDDLVADLFALMDHLAIRETFLLGSSFGSTIALAALHTRPERFRRAILPGAFACRPLAWAEVLAASFGRFLPGRLADWPFIRSILEHNQRAELMKRGADVWDFFVAEHLRLPLRAFASRALMIHQLDLRPKLRAIAKPVLLVYGDRDPLVGKRCEEELKQGLPCVARAEIEDCGHMPQLTHPEVLAELVKQVLAPAACG